MMKYQKCLEYLGLRFQYSCSRQRSTQSVLAQEVFEDPEGKYVVTLPSGWLGIINQDALWAQ
jgi:hypothetical protein